MVGNSIIETPMVLRSRFLEGFAYKDLFVEYFESGARWLSAPKFAIVSAREAWADAGTPQVPPERLGVVVSSGIGGVASTLAAHHIAQPEPSGNGIVAAIGAVLADAGLDPDQVVHVNAHVTSTPRVTRWKARRSRGPWARRRPGWSCRPPSR